MLVGRLLWLLGGGICDDGYEYILFMSNIMSVYEIVLVISVVILNYLVL